MTGLALVLRDATETLSAVSATPRLDAELLMAHILGVDRSTMLLRQHDLLVPDGFALLLARRIGHEPVAYITGVQAFWDLELRVTPDVLIPRADSETLLDAAIDWFGSDRMPARIADLGTGSGALLLAALSIFPASAGYGIDSSTAALGVARDNAERLGFAGRTVFMQRDWSVTGWNADLDGFDLILCNPPYIENDHALEAMVSAHEPHSALFAGPDGLDDYHLLVPQLPLLLNPDGVAIFEIGYNQAEAVSEMGAKGGFSTEVRHDLAGNPRAVRFSLGIKEYND